MSIVAALAEIERTGPSGSEAVWLAPAIAPHLPGADEKATGVYVATPDAGGRASTAFWSRALRETVTLVSPADFPSTLASTVATELARALGLRGPNQTLVGGEEAWDAARDEAEADLSAGIVERALLVRFADGDPARAQAVILAAASPQAITDMRFMREGTGA